VIAEFAHESWLSTSGRPFPIVRTFALDTAANSATVINMPDLTNRSLVDA
jgi:hypothetical protein